VLEVAGAAGVLAGLIRPVLGGLASAGLLLLLAGAMVTHVRNHDGPREVAPAVVCVVLVAGYLVALAGPAG
jgi:DoxX-like family